jgi:bifunctional oligoribonuclease and PAP phosphatase NrnA
MNIQKQIVEKLKELNEIVIVSHFSPDGDSIGSSLSLYHFCKKLNLNVTICHPDLAPKYLQFVDGANEIINFEDHQDLVIQKLNHANVIVCLDFNDQSRVGDKMEVHLKNSSAFKIMIDHHLNPSDFADLLISDSSSCSTCQLIFELIELSGNIHLLDQTIASAIYLGIMTDTGSFRYNNVNSKTHLIISKILETGLKHDVIHENVFDVNTIDKLKLKGYATSEKLVVLENLQTAYISLNKAELDKYNVQKGDTEGLVNVALSIENVKIAAFFSEDEDKIKISFRSKGHENPVNVLANKYFFGGGHANAAGGKFIGTVDEAISTFIRVLPEFI